MESQFALFHSIYCSARSCWQSEWKMCVRACIWRGWCGLETKLKIITKALKKGAKVSEHYSSNIYSAALPLAIEDLKTCKQGQLWLSCKESLTICKYAKPYWRHSISLVSSNESTVDKTIIMKKKEKKKKLQGSSILFQTLEKSTPLDILTDLSRLLIMETNQKSWWYTIWKATWESLTIHQSWLRQKLACNSGVHCTVNVNPYLGFSFLQISRSWAKLLGKLRQTLLD